jgi:hypothetical protein
MNTTNSTRPAAAPAYYLGRSAMVWRTALRQRPHPRHGAVASGSTDRTTRDHA